MSTRFYPNQTDYIAQMNALEDWLGATNDVVSSSTHYPVFATAAAGSNKIASTKLTFVPSTGAFSATTFIGYLQSTDQTVASLPTATTALRGTRSHVTNSTVAASGNFGATVVGGGSNVVPVFCTGTAWIIA